MAAEDEVEPPPAVAAVGDDAAEIIAASMLRSAVVPTSWGAPPEPVGDSRWRFPPPEQWPEQDVIAAGADLEPATLIAAYRRGIFPMPLDVPDRREPLLAWWSPESRGILPLDQFRLTRSLRQSARRFRGPGRHVLRGRHPRVREPGAAERLDCAGVHRGLYAAPRTRMGAQRRGVRSARRARRRAVWRPHQRPVRRRVDVPPAARRFEGCARRARRSDAGIGHDAARRAVAVGSSEVSRRDRSAARALSGVAARGAQTNEDAEGAEDAEAQRR